MILASCANNTRSVASPCGGVRFEWEKREGERKVGRRGKVGVMKERKEKGEATTGALPLRVLLSATFLALLFLVFSFSL